MNQMETVRANLPVVDAPVQVDLGVSTSRPNKARTWGIVLTWVFVALGAFWGLSATNELFTLLSYQDDPPLASLLGNVISIGIGLLVPLGIAVVFWLTLVRGKPRVHEETLPAAPDWLLSHNEFGEPGRGLEGNFDQGAAEAGAKGEITTAALLRETILPAIPAARLFHGLRWPGTAAADIDHALVVGNVVALIDSKFYRNAAYHWDQANEVLYRDGDPTPITLKLGNAVRSAQPYMRANGGGVTPTGVVIIHAAGDEGLDAPSNITSVGSPPHGVPILVGNPVMALGALYNLAVKDNNPSVLNIPLLKTVRSWMY